MPIKDSSAEAIFFAALEKGSPEERAGYLAEACGGDTELRSHVERLLGAHSKVGVLDAPVVTAEEQLPLDPPTLLTPPGTVIGRYKLLEPIGEGGYGTVFMAEQTTPVQRKVALKIIKAGMDTRQVIARFEAERQALALMDHPHIAKVFDAGVTETGRPYFVMELVKGVPITKYCDEHRLEPRQRLELFVQVCQAVQHAHQKGIIHRDLKPNNVLVARYDGKAVPKVIDFGVAKATGQQLTDLTMFTGFGDVIGTLEYMSPEQAEVNQLDVDTRSDIYALGVVLYELLTGTTPLEHNRVKEAALLEVLRVIREEEPPKPSTRLTTTAELPSIAAQRGLEPRHLTKTVHGELDWIVMKALEKDRARRYETANGLAMDIHRYLHDEPVLACPPSAGYRFRKFTRRHRTGLLATTAAFGALLVLVVTLIVSNVRVARERNQKASALAEAQAQRQRAENNLLKARIAVRDLLATPAFEGGDWSKLSPALRKAFRDQTVKYYESLTAEGSTDPSLQYETAVGYRSLGYLHYSAEEHQQAQALYRQSIAILDGLVKQSPKDLEYRHQLAYSHLVLGQTFGATTRPAEAQVEFGSAASLYEALVSEEPQNPNYRQELLRCYLGGMELGSALLKADRLDDAEPVLRTTLAGLERMPREGNVVAWQAHANFSLGVVMRRRNRLAEAEAFCREGIRLKEASAPPHNELGRVLREQGRADEAFVEFKRAAEISPNDPVPHFNLGISLQAKGLLDEALREYRETVRLNPKHEDGYHQLGDMHLEKGSDDEAIAAFREAIELNPNRATHYNCLARALARKSDKTGGTQGRELIRQAVQAAEKKCELEPQSGSSWGLLGSIVYRAGDYKRSIAALEKALELDSSDEKARTIRWFYLCMDHWQLGEKQEARKWYDAAVKWMQQNEQLDAAARKDLAAVRAEAEKVMNGGDGATQPATAPSVAD